MAEQLISFSQHQMRLKSIFGILIALSTFAQADSHKNTIALISDGYGFDFIYGRRYERLMFEINPGLISYATSKFHYSNMGMFRYRTSVNLAYFFPLSETWKIAPEFGTGYFYFRQYNSDPPDNASMLSLSPRLKLVKRIDWANFEMFLGTTTSFWKQDQAYTNTWSTPVLASETDGIDNFQNLGLQFVARFDRFNLGVFAVWSEPFTRNDHYYDGFHYSTEPGGVRIFVSSAGIISGFNF